MNHIDMKFKDNSPEKTVEKIQGILRTLGVETTERWHDSGIDHCWSLTVSAQGGAPSSNGKGVTRELARASAYGEFIERLQCGLFLYKYQSIMQDPQINLHTYAPDGKYMTMQELEENGEWMDPIIAAYGGGLTRKKLAKQCRIYACTQEDKILTVPFFSLFENKYVYLPVGFVEQMYSANGCCAGNTREEAWVHALSEIFERRSEIALMLDKFWAPRIPDEVLQKFPTVMKILDKIRESGDFHITIFDVSLGNGFPVVATRIINKQTLNYVVNTAADPILEIAVHRTLTELFQGRNLQTFSSKHSGSILRKKTDLPLAHNVLNQLETGNGMFTPDFFTEEISCTREFTPFVDLREKNNKELLEHILQLYRQVSLPVYVRDQSFLGFPCFKFVIPGFSETRGLRLTEPIPEFSLGEMAAGTLKNAAAATDDQLQMLLSFHKRISSIWSRRNNFGRLAGLPITGYPNQSLLYITLSYAAYRLKQYPEAMRYLQQLKTQTNCPESLKKYFACVGQYLQLQKMELTPDVVRLILEKFCDTEHVQALYDCLDRNETPYDAYLLQCDCVSCAQCRYRENCAYTFIKNMIRNAGAVYKDFHQQLQAE